MTPPNPADLVPVHDLAVAFVIDSDAACERAVHLVATVARLRRSIEADMRAYTDPLTATIKRIREQYAPALDLLAGAEKRVRDNVAAFRSQAAAVRHAALAAASSVEDVRAAAAVVAPLPEGAHERTYYAAEVVDPALVPDAYWILDTARLDREAREQKDAFAVPGVRLVVTKRLVTRG
jgi:hypothetical protein